MHCQLLVILPLVPRHICGTLLYMEQKTSKKLDAVLLLIILILVCILGYLIFHKEPAPAYIQISNQTNTTPVVTEKKPAPKPLSSCLPKDLTLSTKINDTETVGAKLTLLTASCNSKNVLVDGNQREITFYYLTGCWGTPPPDYQQQMQKQQDELAALAKKYTVIEISCAIGFKPV
jgi:hypothetical protein